MNILVTGATGSFGKAYLRYLVKQKKYDKIVALSRDWQKQKEVRQELKGVAYRIGDVRDLERLEMAFKDIDVVVHAAAIKDLPTCEENVHECIKTNVEGTMNVQLACIKAGVKKALLISTDKAVYPINTYGISKAMAERIFIDGNAYSGGHLTIFSVCRYGNVIGSNGSVVPVYQKLVEDGVERLPLTHEDMTRYWFKMEDAIDLVETSLRDMKGGEVFLPEMKAIRIKDLCKAFNKEYEIIGIRKGEKIHEYIDETRHSGDSDLLTVEEIRGTIWT